MHDLTFINHFSFHEVSYTEYHESSFPFPARYNFIMYLKRGSAQITSEDKTITLNEGDALHIPRGAKYAVKLFGKPEISFGSYAYLNYQENGKKRYELQKISLNENMRDLIVMVSRIDGVTLESIGYFYLFLNEMYNSLPALPADKKEKLVARAWDFIERRPDCKMAEVAEHCHISESGLYALFSERSSLSPARLRTLVKLERAVNYLTATDIPIEQISEICGFSSSSYFRKKLYSVYRRTPTEIRREGAPSILGF